MEEVAKDFCTCEKIIESLGVTTNGGGTMNINDENGVPKNGLKGDSPGCTWHPGNAKDGRHQLLVRGIEKPTCDSPTRPYTARRRVCACKPCPKVHCTSDQLAINYEGADYGICTNQETDTGNWNVYYSAESMLYLDAKDKCSSLGATLVGDDALETVRFW